MSNKVVSRVHVRKDLRYPQALPLAGEQYLRVCGLGIKKRLVVLTKNEIETMWETIIAMC